MYEKNLQHESIAKYTRIYMYEKFVVKVRYRNEIGSGKRKILVEESAGRVLWVKSRDVVQNVFAGDDALQPTVAQHQTLTYAQFAENLRTLLKSGRQKKQWRKMRGKLRKCGSSHFSLLKLLKLLNVLNNIVTSNVT